MAIYFRRIFTEKQVRRLAIRFLGEELAEERSRVS